jgi:uncharacterized membrane protein
MDFSLLGFSGLKEVMNVHPVFVHFPIALFPAALLFYGLGAVLEKRSLLVSGRGCLYLAAVSVITAVATGLRAEATLKHNEAIHHLMETHKTLGLTILALSLLLTGWTFWQRDQRPRAFWAYFCVLTFTTLAVQQNADLGGRMVFTQGAGVKPTQTAQSSPEEADKQESMSMPPKRHAHPEIRGEKP